MGRIIFTVVLLLVLTVVIVMNLGPVTPINLFGARFHNVPLVAVAMVSFALGLVYSLFLYIGQYLHRASRDRLARKHKDIEERERKLAAAQADSEARTESPDQTASAGPGQSPPAAGHKEPRSALSRFFRMFR